MDINLLTRFFMWCTIINVSLLTFWFAVYVLDADLVYRTQCRWFEISRETFGVLFYSFFGLFKIVVIVFNIVPYIVLLIIG